MLVKKYNTIHDVKIEDLLNKYAILQIIKDKENYWYSCLSLHQTKSLFKPVMINKYFASRRETIQKIYDTYKIIVKLQLNDNKIIENNSWFSDETEGSYIVGNK